MGQNKKQKEIFTFIKERTFGDIIGAVFQFIIQEFKPFAGALLKFAGPFVAVAFLAVSLLANDIYNDVIMNTSLTGTTAVYGIILALALMLGLLSVTVVTHSYITLYVENGKGNFTKEEVGALLKKNILKVFGAGILMYIMIIVGFLLLYIPGIYLATALSFVFLIIIYEKQDVGKAISRSFEVVKGKWWQTFALILVFGMIIGMSSYVFIIPIYAVVIVAVVSGTQIGSGSVIFISLFVFLYFTAYLFFMSMQQILIAVQYFNIRTAKEGLELKDRIKAIHPDESSKGENESKKSIQKNENQEQEITQKTKEKNRFTDEESNDRFKPKN